MLTMGNLIINTQREVLHESLEKKEKGKPIKTDIIYKYLEPALYEELKSKGYEMSESKDGLLVVL